MVLTFTNKISEHEGEVETILLGKTAQGENSDRGDKVKDRTLGSAYFKIISGGHRAWEGERTDQKSRKRAGDRSVME